MNSILLVLTALSLKHFFADFPLQTQYMLRKGKKGYQWIFPLAAHAAVHAGFTLLIFLIYDPRTAWVACVDFAAHFVVDRIKATYPMPQGVWADHERGTNLRRFYVAFGLDQLAHHLTYIGLVYLALSYPI